LGNRGKGTGGFEITNCDLKNRPVSTPQSAFRNSFGDARDRLAIAVFATVKAVLFDLLLALWRHGNPMLKSRLPMQPY
jgi:hypothetical protein